MAAIAKRCLKLDPNIPGMFVLIQERGMWSWFVLLPLMDVHILNWIILVCLKLTSSAQPMSLQCHFLILEVCRDFSKWLYVRIWFFQVVVFHALSWDRLSNDRTNFYGWRHFFEAGHPVQCFDRHVASWTQHRQVYRGFSDTCDLFKIIKIIKKGKWLLCNICINSQVHVILKHSLLNIWKMAESRHYDFRDLVSPASKQYDWNNG